jgi:hypothetical protein
VTIFVSIVSHKHTDDIILGLQPKALQGDGIRVVIVDNQPDAHLAEYCAQHQLAYLKNAQPQGFGRNHNQAFTYCRTHLGLTGCDWFVVLNPDVLVPQSALYQMVATMTEYSALLAAPNLFKDKQLREQEASVRRFPYIWNAAASFLFKATRTTLNRQAISTPCPVDWASGAFLAFRADLYERLGGFDERDHLYYEDVDICWRALKRENVPVHYLPNIKAVHAGKRDSHKSAGRHFWWHIASVFRFSWVRIKTRLCGIQSLERPTL